MGSRLSFPLEEIFPLLGCAPCPGTARRVVTDSRQIEPGDLFVALQGERFNAHDFLPDVAARGACAAIVQQRQPELALAQCAVADTRRALGQIAAWHAARLQPDCVIGVTGSNGKTTVKEMLAAILRQTGETLATAGNLNNEIGVPLMLLRLQPAHRHAVLEMGANHVGEIHWIASLVRPHVGIITQAAEAHVGEFGSLEAIIRTKGELIDHIRSGGTVVLNGDSVGFLDWQARARARDIAVRVFGRQPQADMQILSVRQSGGRLTVVLSEQDGESQTLVLPLYGSHHAWNAAAAALAARTCGVPWAQIRAALSRFHGAPGRLQPHELKKGGILLDDSYNANPASVRAAVSALTALPGRPVVCLGTLAELGAARDALLHELGQWLAQQGVERLYLLGEGLEALQAGFGDEAVRMSDHAALADRLVQDILEAPGPVNILLKGSRVARMEDTLKWMREHHAAVFDGLAGAV